MRRTQREARLLLLFALAAVGCLIGLVAAWHHRTPLAANQHTINQLTDELALARAQTVHAKPSPQRHGSSAQPSILVVMNSVARANQAPYLLHTLQSITREATAMVGPFSDSLTVLIRNPHPVSRPHPVFKEAEAKFSRSAAPRFIFEQHEGDVVLDQTHPGKWRQTTRADVQLTTDLLALLAAASDWCTDLLLLMEDDFEWCPNTATHLAYILAAANRLYPEWAGGRVGFGMNGVLLRCGYLGAIRRYLNRNILLGPADSMLGLFWTSDKLGMGGDVPLDAADDSQLFDGRQFWSYRYNLLLHIGTNSTHAVPSDFAPAILPQCFDTLATNALMPREMFDFAGCAHADFSPCDGLRQPEGLVATASNRWHTQITKPVGGVIRGERGRACADACAAKDLRCVPEMILQINNCELLRSYFTCYSCEAHPLSSNQLASRNPGFEPNTGVCLFSAISTLVSCNESLETLQPLCPCM